MSCGTIVHPLGICPRVVLLGLEVNWFPIFWETTILISKVAVQVCTPTSSGGVFPWLYIISNIYSLWWDSMLSLHAGRRGLVLPQLNVRLCWLPMGNLGPCLRVIGKKCNPCCRRSDHWGYMRGMVLPALSEGPYSFFLSLLPATVRWAAHSATYFMPCCTALPQS